jgi:hypothetical protein
MATGAISLMLRKSETLATAGARTKTVLRPSAVQRCGSQTAYGDKGTSSALSKLIRSDFDVQPLWQNKRGAAAGELI